MTNKMKVTTHIVNKQQYEKTKERLVNGEKLIKEYGGFQKAPANWVKGYQFMAEALLEYEIIHNLLPANL